MPNHCENDLYIGGPAEKVAELLAYMGADQDPPAFDFSKVIEYPAQFAELDREMAELGYKGFEEKYGRGAKDGFNSGGYEWCRENWGTKWNAYSVRRRDDGATCVSFQTAWNPPEPVIVELHKQFPECNLYLEFFECGMGFCGGFSVLSKDDYYDEEAPWQPGTKSDEWRGEYRGHRGG